jgi:hypothetical protein
MSNKEATLLLKIKEVGSEALSKVTDLLSGIADAAKYVGAAIVGFAGVAVAAYREQEEATNALSQSMINQGIYSTDLAKKYQDQASQLQKLTTFGDEQIISAQAVLQGYVGQREVTQELTQATLNLAAAKKMDLASAAELVGKTIGTTTNALARQGVEMKEGLTTTEKYAAVIAGINGKWEGMAEAQAKGLGSVAQLKNAFSDILETVGEKLSPAISAGAKVMTNWLQQLGSSSRFIDMLDASLTIATKGFIYLKTGILNLGGVIGTVLGASIESVSLLMSGQFTKAKEVAALGIQQIGAVVKENMAAQDAELAMIDEQKRLAVEAKQAEELAKLQQSEDNKSAVKAAAAAKDLAVLKKQAEDEKKIEEKKNAEMTTARTNFLSHMAAMQSSHNSLLASIGKAAAIAQITISTAQAAADGFKWGMAVGGPALATAFSSLAYASGAAQIAKVAGVQLADGGIVKATPGGVPAIIGEGGKDEAVIPLENGQVPGGGGGVTINIHGNLVGDEQSLYALAKMLDPQMLKLRQNNESVAFDTGVF